MTRESEKREKAKQKQRKKRWKRINAKIDRTVWFLAVLVCLIFSVADVLERQGKINLKRTKTCGKEKTET